MAKTKLFETKLKIITVVLIFTTLYSITAWAGLSTTDVSQLYVSIFGRASEGEGNAYWSSTQGSIAEVADLMLDTDAAKNYFGASLDSNQAFIEHIYLNTLSKTLADDPVGIAYWVGELNQGFTRGEVAASLVGVINNYAPDGPSYNPDDAKTIAAYSQFTNRVEVSNYMALNVQDAPVDWATSTSFTSGLVVTDVASTVSEAKSLVDMFASNSTVTTVETTRDDRGVWFISGTGDATIHNIFEAQGYAEATDRLWQAELYKRTARGRLAEIFGSSQLTSDVLMRTTGYSEEELLAGFDALGEELKTIFQAYVDGFNRRIAEVTADTDLLPFEFKALGILPENWSILDLLAWESTMLRNFDPEATSQFQIENMSLFSTLAALFPADAQAMFSDLRWTNDPDALTYYTGAATITAKKSSFSSMGLPARVLPDAATIPNYSKVADSISQRYKEVQNNLKEINAFVKMGSYAWSVAGTKTQSGNPIIYSGPQMGFSTPSIVVEGSIRAGGLDVSGMSVPGLPGIIIGRTPHHAWSMQVANGHTTDYYLESPDSVTLHRTETIKVAGAADVTLPVYRTVHGPVVNPMPYDPTLVSATNPVIAWKYSHWENEFNSLGGMMKLARAKSMDDFGDGIEDISVSQHFCYADVDGNVAYWMSGRDPVRSPSNWMVPQGFGGATPMEWDTDLLKPRSTERNPTKGYYCGWNNKDSNLSESGMNAASKQFGPYDRAHVVDDYLKDRDNLTFEELRDLVKNITTTDSFDLGGNPWKFVSDDFTAAITSAGVTDERQSALDILGAWDGHFVAGGADSWVAGGDRADGWILMDAWIREVIRLTFEDELASVFEDQNKEILFNVILHGLKGASSGIVNNYNWFQNLSDATAPQTPDTIIVQALDTVLASLGEAPWGKDQRGEISYSHDMLGIVHTMPYSSRSTYAHCVEMGSAGPVRIESMFPLGESGTILMNSDGTPSFNDYFFSMAPLFDTMTHRSFPLFD